MANKSLTKQLSLLLAAVQITAFIVSILVMLAVWLNSPERQVPKELAQEVASSLSLSNSGIRFDENKLPAEFLSGTHHAWVIAQADSGANFQYGEIPTPFTALAKDLKLFEESFIRSRFDQYAATLIVLEQNGQTLRVLVGGYSEKGLLSGVVALTQYVFIPMLLPALVIAMICMPWLINRRLKCLTNIAAEAANIDLASERQGYLSTDVPSEIAPLIKSFNNALRRIRGETASRDRFLADAAHELRMPLAVLRTRIGMLPNSSEKSQLTTDLWRLENIADQLLDLQRLSNDTYKRKNIDIVSICEEIAMDLGPLILDAGYEFSFESTLSSLNSIGDHDSFKRMLINLLHNAVVHGGNRGEICLEISKEGVISISDSGPGIPQDERENIFRPFYRLQPSISGSGLGLHLATEVAVAHNYKITTHDSVKGGAIFRVSPHDNSIIRDSLGGRTDARSAR